VVAVPMASPSNTEWKERAPINTYPLARRAQWRWWPSV
jgi:hypothetical protein